ncbi:hypothetical protein BWQ96_07481 [Gracilariopsis chorda]|uniref:Uncharacterized protein n=1 Tax=Gracilariopsis chorda TaxID=448386 RepID=A0A2V3IL14_9FLOR|nr:hypothetical protein BWQ96_07481 [Gracilariopsis chorda]|eukprot:PXF42774.1 hypothetical protein BWQ96_07481 [Gracilariopsis chorda]
MRRDHAASLSFVSLSARLLSAKLTKAELQAILEEHKDDLFRTIKLPQPTDKSDLNYVRYRKHSPETTEFPRPTNAELDLIPSIEKNLGLSQYDAALLLRDYLAHTEVDDVTDILRHRSDLAAVAPLHYLEQFWRQQKRAAFSSLTTILVLSLKQEAHEFRQQFHEFVSASKGQIQDIIVNCVIVTLESYKPNVKPPESALGNVEPSRVMELLFAFSIAASLSIEAKSAIFTRFVEVAKSQKSPLNHSHEVPSLSKALIDGGEGTVLFVAALNCTNELSVAIHPPDVSMGEPESSEPTSARDRRTPWEDELNELYCSLHQSSFAESALLCLSWSCRLKFNSGFGKGKKTSVTRERPSDVPHMTYALTTNVFRTLQEISDRSFAISESLEAYLFKCFWDDIAAFLTAFRPTKFSPLQVNDMVRLASTFLTRSGENTSTEEAHNLWNDVESDSEVKGIHVLLRLASGVFPLSYLPLTKLLSVLVVDKKSAACATFYLEDRLDTVTEVSAGYKDLLVAIDEDPHDIWLSLADQLGPDVDRIASTFSMVQPAEGEVVFLQSSTDLPGDSYRSTLPRGSVGIGSLAHSVVTWICPFNGFDAVLYIIDMLQRILGEDGASLSLDESFVEELVSSGLESLMLIDRLCRKGSPALRGHITNDLHITGMIAKIFGHLADPPERILNSWLSKKRHEVLLTASASCLASIAIGSRDSALIALEHLESSQRGLPLHTAMATLGEAAFPALAAISRVTDAWCATGSPSERIMEVLRKASQSPRQRAMWEFLERFRGSQKRIHEFLASTALPLWLTTPRYESTLRQPAELHWLLPACSLRFFSSYPDALLKESTVCAVFGEVITSASKLKVLEEADTFLFPALCAGMTACYEALQLRNAALQARRKKSTGHDGMVDSEPTLLEKVLLSPEVVYAMAMIASGSVDVLLSAEFYKRWERSYYKHLFTDLDQDMLLRLNTTTHIADNQTITSWPMWIADMSARCLSLQFSCLRYISRNGATIQVPWPSRHKSALGFWRGGGDVVCKGFVRRIERERSVSILELLMAILACGQRAAARSLMGPRASSKSDSPGTSGPRKRRTVHFETPEANRRDERDKSTKPQKTLQQSVQKEESGPLGVDTQDDQTYEIFRAVTRCLSECQEEFVTFMQESRLPDVEDERPIGRIVGPVSLFMAVCVRFLRVGRESHYSNWFRTCWDQLSTWKVLSNMLRCSGSPSKQAECLDLAEAISVPYSILDNAGIENKYEQIESNPSAVDSVLRELTMSFDVASIWKSIAADVLLLFCSDITEKSRVSQLNSKNDNPHQAKGNKSEQPTADHSQESLSLFSSVFTERWMHVLLDVDGSFTSRPYKDLMSIPSVRPTAGSPKKRRTAEPLSSDETEVHSILRDFSSLVGLSSSAVHGSELLNQCRRTGDAQMRYGAEYAFDVHKVRRFLYLFDVSPQSAFGLLIRIIRLNIVLTRRDVQMEVSSSFCSTSAAAMYADSSPGVHTSGNSGQLTYTSPQFGGKLCRFLSRALVCLSPRPTVSAHTLTIASDFAKLMVSLSARLSKDELTIPVLTKITFSTPPIERSRECGLSPVAQICSFIDQMLHSLKAKKDKNFRSKLVVVRWLLLSAARLLKGPSFSDTKDVRLLCRTAFLALEVAKGIADVNASAAVALFSVIESIEKRDGEPISKCFDESAFALIFSSISSLEQSSRKGDDRRACCETTANLLLVVARIQILSRAPFDMGVNTFSLTQLSRGTIQAFLPPESGSILTYDALGESRDATHLVWCSTLHLASVVIPTVQQADIRLADKEVWSRDILEFCSTNFPRIVRESLDLFGDWPREAIPEDAMDTTGYKARAAPRHLTIARIEEAELAALTLMKSSFFAVELKDKIPKITGQTLGALCQYVSRVTRLLRAEPVERWVRPITRREKERSHLLRADKNYEPTRTEVLYKSSSTPTSPLPSYGGKRTPPRRSPSQAVREALGGFHASQSLFPPSPVSSTPLRSPSPDPEVNLGSPKSPWDVPDPGLITKGDLFFGEEASRSLLRGLSFAICALRKFSTAVDTVFFRANMSSYEDPPGIGVLMSILSYACNELRVRTDGERREQLISLSENGLHLLITHTLIFEEQGQLSQGVKDELRNRTSTILSRLSRVKPPLPQGTLIQSPLVKNFLYNLH